MDGDPFRLTKDDGCSSNESDDSSHDGIEDLSPRRRGDPGPEFQKPLRQAKIKFAEDRPDQIISDKHSMDTLLKKELKRSSQEIVALPFENITHTFDDDISDSGQQISDMGPIRRPAWKRWLCVAVISVAVALQLSCMLVVEIKISKEKFRLVEWLYFDGQGALALTTLLIYAMVAGGFSVLLVLFVSPHASSSGIVDTKAYLNGHHIPGFLSFRAWLARSVSLVLITSAGLFAGTEGPLVAHLGAIISCGIAKGRLKICGRRIRMPWRLVGHRTQCEFVLIGTAMGMAAAFGSPVGGVLFSMEFVHIKNTELTILVFFGSALAGFLAKVFKNGFTEGFSNFHFPLSSFVEFPDSSADFEAWELFAFLFIGLLTGFAGAIFCKGAQLVGKCRSKIYTKRTPRFSWRLAEVLLHSNAVVLTCILLPMALGCRQLEASSTDPGTSQIGTQVQGFCDSGQYTDLGTLVMQPKHEAVKALFTKGFEGGAHFTYEALFSCYLTIFVFTLIGTGMAMPAGLYVPHIMAGGCLGRMVGQWMQEISGDRNVHPGVYALVGAAGQLAGFSRMSLSLTLIMVEITNNVRLMLPVMLSIMVSKSIADLFIPSYFDVALGFKPQIQMLDGEWQGSDAITILDICSTTVTVLHCHVQLSQAAQILKESSYHAFPLVEGHRSHVVGVIYRSKLVDMISISQRRGEPPSTIVDLKLYADMAPETKHWQTPARRAFRDFMSMGLQQLCVVDQTHALLGIVTRSDLRRLCDREGRQTIRERIAMRLQVSGVNELKNKKNGSDSTSGGSALTKENLLKLEELHKKVAETEAASEELSNRLAAAEEELLELRPLRDRILRLEQYVQKHVNGNSPRGEHRLNSNSTESPCGLSIKIIDATSSASPNTAERRLFGSESSIDRSSLNSTGGEKEFESPDTSTQHDPKAETIHRGVGATAPSVEAREEIGRIACDPSLSNADDASSRPVGLQHENRVETHSVSRAPCSFPEVSNAEPQEAPRSSESFKGDRSGDIRSTSDQQQSEAKPSLLAVLASSAEEIAASETEEQSQK